MAREGRTGSKIHSNGVIIALLALLVVAGFALAGWLYVKNQELKNQSPQVQQQEQKNKAVDIKAKVGKLIDVPKDETPTLATVTDKEKLKDQPFFKDAQNGDQILIFPQAKKAIIYRESENKLINVGPIAITSDTAKEESAKQKAPTNGE